MGKKMYAVLLSEVLPCADMTDFGARPGNSTASSFYASASALNRYMCGWYGIGHTNRRHPGDMRGTVIGKQGRFKGPFPRKEVMFGA